MSALKDALKGVGSEIQLSGPLGFFLQKLVKLVDTLLNAGALGLAGAEFLEVGQSGGNALVQLNTDLVLNTITIAQGIPYDPSTGVATLTAGRTYSLRAAGSMVSFIGGAPPFFDVTWVDAVSNAPLNSLAVGTWVPVSDVSNEAPSDSVEVLYQPSGNQTVKLRCTAGGGGTAQAVAGHFWGVIQQIG